MAGFDSDFLDFLRWEKLKDETGDIQVSALVHIMGRQAESIYNSFQFDLPPALIEDVSNPPDPSNNFNLVLQKFEDCLVTRRNTIQERTKFYQRNQKPGESVECFVRSVHNLAAHCDFGVQTYQ